MRFELFIATRYLRAKRRQAFIGIITGISIAGVAAGVASLVVALAINNGFRQDLQQRLLGSTSHVSLQRIADDGIRDWPPLLDRLSKQPHVVAAAPAIFEQVLISRGPRARGAVLKGMIPADERRVGDLLNSVRQGSAAELDPAPAADHDSGSAQPAGSSDSLADVHARVAAMPPIILGKDMADNLGATVGSVVLVTSPQGELISVIEFKVDDIDKADTLARQIEDAAGKGFMTTNWKEQNKALFHALNMERLVTYITVGLIVFVAALNILISLIMMVMEKTRDIAVLISMGTRTS